MPVVGLERTLYEVSENVGVVEVCAAQTSSMIDCPFNFSFSVLLYTRDSSAGACVCHCAHVYCVCACACVCECMRLTLYGHIDRYT